MPDQLIPPKTLYFIDRDSEGTQKRVRVYFKRSALVVERYMQGEAIKYAMDGRGDGSFTDYIHVWDNGQARLCTALNVPPGDRQALLEAIAIRFHAASCFEDFKKLLKENGIPC